MSALVFKFSMLVMWFFGQVANSTSKQDLGYATIMTMPLMPLAKASSPAFFQ